jgi:hypothetical protein
MSLALFEADLATGSDTRCDIASVGNGTALSSLRLMESWQLRA